MQVEVKLILYNCFKVLSFISEVVIFFWSYVVSLGVYDGCIDVVSVIFCRGCSGFGFVVIVVSFLIDVMVRVGVVCRQCDIVVECVGGCGVEVVVILFVNCMVMVVFILVLQCEVQIVNQIEEVGVMVGCDVVGMIGYVVVGIVLVVIVLFNQYIGCCFDVVDCVVVMVIVE